MFKGSMALKDDIDDLVRVVKSFQKTTLMILTDTTAPRRNREIELLKKDVSNFAQRARAIVNDPAFNTAAIGDDERHNATVIADEFAAALAEIDEVVDPDKHWSRLTGGDKTDIIREARVADEHTQRIRDRLTGKLVGVNVAPINPKK